MTKQILETHESYLIFWILRLYKKCYVKFLSERNRLNENRCTWTAEPEGGFFCQFIFSHLFSLSVSLYKGKFHIFVFVLHFQARVEFLVKAFNPGSTSDAFHSNASVYFDEIQRGVFKIKVWWEFVGYVTRGHSYQYEVASYIL